MDSLFSFPVGLFHPLQHAGLSRRSPGGRPSAPNIVRRRLRLDEPVLPSVSLPIFSEKHLGQVPQGEGADQAY